MGICPCSYHGSGGTGRDRETGPRCSAGDAPFQQQSAIALPKGRETGASETKRRFSVFFCGRRHPGDKAHCTRFVQCASCKEWGVQPQSATSRLPIQRKGEREIAESCYVRMIPRGLYRRSRHPGVRNCEGAKSINIHVNCFLIKFWASIFQKSINSLSNFGKVRLTGDIHYAVLFVKIGIRHVLTADFRESQVTSTDSYVSVSSDCRFLRVLAELSLTMQEICRNCRHRIRIHSRERSQSWHRRSAVRCNSTRTVVGERILSGGGVMIRKNQPPASWNKGGVQRCDAAMTAAVSGAGG